MLARRWSMDTGSPWAKPPMECRKKVLTGARSLVLGGKGLEKISRTKLAQKN